MLKLFRAAEIKTLWGGKSVSPSRNDNNLLSAWKQFNFRKWVDKKTTTLQVIRGKKLNPKLPGNDVKSRDRDISYLGVTTDWE